MALVFRHDVGTRLDRNWLRIPYQYFDVLLDLNHSAGIALELVDVLSSAAAPVEYILG